MFGNAKLREFASLYSRFTLSYTESTFQCFQGAYRVYTQRVGKETPGETFHGSRTVHRVAKKRGSTLYESRREKRPRITPGVSMSSSVTRISLVLPFFNRISCVHSFVRSFVIAIPWRHRIVFSPVVAVSHRRFSHLGHASRDQEALEQLRGHVATVLEDAVERARAAVVVAAESAAFREGRRRK